MTQTNTGTQPARSTDLLRSSIKFFHIVLMVTAAAAPLVVVSTYIPLSIGYGAGMSTPVTYIATTVILLIFSVGFAQMAKRITSAGAFYTFSTQGLGKPTGLAVGFMIVAAYSMIAAAISGGFGFFGAALVSTYFKIDIAWYWYSIAGLALMFLLSYFRVTVGAKFLGIALTLEVLVVFAVCAAVIVQGGQDGQQPGSLLPSAWSTAPAIGIGFFLAFWSWIGFETTAIYGEETKDPKKAVPRATYIAVITLGIFYTFAAYAGIVGFGQDSPAKASELVGLYYFDLADMYTMPFVRPLMDVLVVTGFFACTFAFHNNAARYFFSLGRDGILPRRLGTTNPVHKSPAWAAGLQTVIAITTVAIFAFAGADPLLQLATWLPIFCTLAVIVVQLIVSIAVIGYFNRIGRSGAGDMWKTMIAPLIGVAAQAVVIWLLIQNLTFLAGSEIILVQMIPLYVVIIAVIGFAYALILKSSSPARYATIGQLHDQEMMEIFPDEEFVNEAPDA
jgi:amino acid transporter